MAARRAAPYVEEMEKMQAASSTPSAALREQPELLASLSYTKLPALSGYEYEDLGQRYAKANAPQMAQERALPAYSASGTRLLGTQREGLHEALAQQLLDTSFTKYGRFRTRHTAAQVDEGIQTEVLGMPATIAAAGPGVAASLSPFQPTQSLPNPAPPGQSLAARAEHVLYQGSMSDGDEDAAAAAAGAGAGAGGGPGGEEGPSIPDLSSGQFGFGAAAKTTQEHLEDSQQAAKGAWEEGAKKGEDSRPGSGDSNESSNDPDVDFEVLKAAAAQKAALKEMSMSKGPIFLLAQKGLQLLSSDLWNAFLAAAILLAALIAGLREYSEYDTPMLAMVLTICQFVFTIEMVLKIISAGLVVPTPDEIQNILADGHLPPRPELVNTDIRIFFWDKSNVIDLVVVIAAWALKPLVVLRLFRLFQMTSLITSIPQCRVLMGGLMGGMQQIQYLMALGFVLLYIFAVLAVFLFKTNDPSHFRDLGTSITSILRIITTTDFSRIMNINAFGCHRYGYLDTCIDPRLLGGNWTKAGWDARIDLVPWECPDLCGVHCCRDPSSANEALSVVFHFVVVIMLGVIALALFVGSLITSLEDSFSQYEDYRAIKERHKLKARLDLQQNAINEEQAEKVKSLLKGATALEFELESIKPPKWIQRMFPGEEQYEKIRDHMVWAHELDQWIEEDIIVNNVLFLAIAAAGITAGLSTSDEFENSLALFVVDWFIVGIFIIEFLAKVLAKGIRPWMYFASGWNVFDFVVLVLCIIPADALGGGSDSQLRPGMILRMFRLLRLVRLIRSLDQLKVIITGLMKGMDSILLMSTVVALSFYMFGVLGMAAFRDNDPHHFSDPWKAFVTVFTVSLLSDWTDVMYINQYGCAAYPLSDVPGQGYLDEYGMECSKPTKHGYVAVVYFNAMIIVVNYVLLSMFVSVVVRAMQQANEEIARYHLAGRTSRNLIVAFGIIRPVFDMYVQTFAVICGEDDTRNTMSMAETRGLLKIICHQDVDNDELRTVQEMIDPDGSGNLNLQEFLQLLIVLRRHTIQPEVAKYCTDKQFKMKFDTRRNIDIAQGIKVQSSLKDGTEDFAEEEDVKEDTESALFEMKNTQIKEMRSLINRVRRIEDWRDTAHAERLRRKETPQAVPSSTESWT